jgi:hypothetical protein
MNEKLFKILMLAGMLGLICSFDLPPVITIPTDFKFSLMVDPETQIEIGIVKLNA